MRVKVKDYKKLVSRRKNQIKTQTDKGGNIMACKGGSKSKGTKKGGRKGK